MTNTKTESPGAEIKVFDGREDANSFLLDLFLTTAAQAVAERGSFRAALSGGSTPYAFYRQWRAAREFPWDRSEIFLVDERFVAERDRDHNGRGIREIFGQALGSLEAPRLHLIETDKFLGEGSEAGAASAAVAYEHALSEVFGPGLPVFDLILLGMGPDGHTASIFPGTGAETIRDRSVISVRPLTAPHDRVSLSLPVLNAARRCVFLVLGSEKTDALRRVLIERDRSLPSTLVGGGAGSPLFVLDSDAAAGL